MLPCRKQEVPCGKLPEIAKRQDIQLDHSLQIAFEAFRKTKKTNGSQRKEEQLDVRLKSAVYEHVQYMRLASRTLSGGCVATFSI